MAHLGPRKPHEMVLLCRLAGILGLAVAVFLVFRLIPSHQFVNWDDPSIFPEFLAGRWLSLRSLYWAIGMDGGDWQPIGRLLLLLQAASVGISARAVHLSSVLCHGFNTVLLFLLSEKILDLNRQPSAPRDPRVTLSCFLAAGLVMCHPLRVEAVAWASSQSTLWCTTFGLLALLSFLALVQNPQQKRYALCVILCVVSGLLIKPNFISVVVWILTLAWYAREPQSTSLPPEASPKGTVLSASLAPRRTFASFLIAYFGPPWLWTDKCFFRRRPLIAGTVALSLFAALATVLLTVYTRQKFQDIPNVKIFSLVDALPRMGYVFGFYIQKTVFPIGLSPFVGWPADSGERVGTTVFGIAIFLALAFWNRRRPGVLLLLVAFATGLAPALGILKLGRFVAADRYTYVASSALAPLCAAFFLAVWRQNPKPSQLAFLSLCAALLAFFIGTASYQETKAWRDSLSLWQHALDNGGGIYADVHSNYGGALEGDGKYLDALKAYDRAIAIDPFFPDAHIGRAVVLYRLGRLGEAIDEAKIAVRYGGDYLVAWQNLAAFLVSQKSYEEARPVVAKALSLAPEAPTLLFLSGQLYAEVGQYQAARDLFGQVVSLRPDWVDPQIALGATLALLGQKSEGRKVLENAVRLHPESRAARGTLEALTKGN